MKLLTKTSLHYLWVSMSLLSITCVLLFSLLKRDVSAEIEEQLELQHDMVTAEIQKGNPVNFPLVMVKPEKSKSTDAVFSDTVMHDARQNVSEDYYMLTQSKLINGKYYRITVMTTYIGWNEYLKAITTIFIVLAVLLIVAGTVVNYLISRKVWKPFFTNMQLLKNFSVAKNEELVLTKSNINEFEELNAVMLSFADHARKEYKGLQEFSENASHELQTPISIIRTRLDSISQLPLPNEAVGYLGDAKRSLTRLSKVNKGLLLLAKLTHDSFPDQQEMSLSAALNDVISQLEELFLSRGLQLQQHVAEVSAKASPHLVNIMLSNLLSNMLKNTRPDAALSVSLNADKLIFKNEGEPLPFAEEVLFTRFKKNKKAQSGIGLGLSIVRQICQVHQWDIQYSYTNQTHIFTVYLKADQYPAFA
ncbi:HAMP domain-containing sensor histidine kinase [Mucilaginibacter gynuensis]|uniref:histidine kinase n=1 Tax=Mucilaginibacter gynuensis TaxID=1302236 RepID=A0ABP8G9T5_9SPHI